MEGEVLVVGGDDASTDAVCDALREGGRSVARAVDGRAAVERIVSLPTLTALVVDTAPEGAAAAEALAEFARKVIPDLPVIYLTAVAEAAAANGASEAGVRIAKPVSAGELAAALDGIAGR